MMHSEDPRLRAEGCKLAARRGDAADVSLLVDRLQDRDPAVRMFAGRALRELTGQDLGYRASDPPEVRAQAVARWRAFADARAAGGGGSR